ncbi:Sec1 family protein, putative [Babesia caballi]|uniref:Sec1 family protein, putative n=1 Tax=Babesia caballi TaxID=5871 RepID=A0AAV4LU54_BABCB|nr:Sec1 family protein, putative [Babesia caballi]
MSDDGNPYHFGSVTSLLRDNYASMLDRVKGLKLLILDDATASSMSLVQTHSYLLENGVLLTTSISDDNIYKGDASNLSNLRHLKAVYIIQPSHANVSRLCDQLRGAYFKEYHLYFTSLPLDGQLEMLAKNDVMELVCSVYAYHTDLMAICRYCFLLDAGTSDLYTSVHSGEAARVSQGLFNVFRIIKQIPSVVHVNGSNEARELGLKVQSLLNNDLLNSEAILKTYSKFGTADSFGCCLLIYDRKFDCVTPLMNQWSYQAMIHEMLPTSRNSVRVGEEDFVLSADFDDFYGAHLFKEFTDVEAALSELIQENKKNLSDAMNVLQNLPKQTKMTNETKRHVAILHELSRLIQTRQLLQTALLEQDMGTHAKGSAEAFDAVVEQLNSPSVEASEKLRLALIFCVEYSRHEDKVNMIKDNLRMNGLESEVPKVDALLQYAVSAEAVSDASAFLSLAKMTLNKSLLPHSSSPYMQYCSRLSQVVGSLLKGRLDSRQFSLIPSSYDLEFSFANRPCSVVVYVVGGITFAEYRDLQALSASTGPKDRWQLTDENRPTVSALDKYREVLSGDRRKAIRRSDFLKFTGGRQPLISSHLKANLIGRRPCLVCMCSVPPVTQSCQLSCRTSASTRYDATVTSKPTLHNLLLAISSPLIPLPSCRSAAGIFFWCIFACYMTYRVMRPEDYAWVDAERERIEAAKAKMQRIIELEKRGEAPGTPSQ